MLGGILFFYFLVDDKIYLIGTYTSNLHHSSSSSNNN